MSFWCVICQNNIFMTESISVLSCGHFFHSKCQMELVLASKPCSICKTDIDIRKIRKLHASIRNDVNPNMLDMKSKNSCIEKEVIDGLTTQVKSFQDNIEMLKNCLKQTNDMIEINKNLNKNLEIEHAKLKKKFEILEIQTNYNQEEDSVLRSELEKLKDNPDELVSKFLATVLSQREDLTKSLNAIIDLEQENEHLESKNKTNAERIKNHTIICEDYQKQREEHSKWTSKVRPTCKGASIDSSTIVIDVDESETPVSLSDKSLEDASSITCKTDVKKRRKRKPNKKK